MVINLWNKILKITSTKIYSQNGTLMDLFLDFRKVLATISFDAVQGPPVRRNCRFAPSNSDCLRYWGDSLAPSALDGSLLRQSRTACGKSNLFHNWLASFGVFIFYIFFWLFNSKTRLAWQIWIETKEYLKWPPVVMKEAIVICDKL